MKKTISVRDAMTKTPIVTTLNSTVRECAKLMVEKKIGSLVIQENGILKGVLTERDIIKKVIAKNKNSKEVKASEIMTSIAITINQEKDLQQAIKIMNQNNIRRLPVVDNEKKLLGLLTIKDIIKLQPEMIEMIMEKSKWNRCTNNYNEGECHLCGNYTLVKQDNHGKLICHDCQRNI